ncbi:MAG: right-handed parallel beta-helix repeat-containing protein [Candidatus Aegiribacteria sp.]|nr:right-handed parallel beta-helix repeat-containing protein [Candidatus Aegiribacteria sp.]
MKFTPGTVLPVAFAMLLFTVSAGAETYYVSTTGDNGNSGTSPGSAFATIQYAADIVTEGDSVLVLDGEYAGFDLRTSGSQTSPIVFAAMYDNAVINQQNPVTADGINIENAEWIIIDGFNLTGLPRNGVRVAVSSNVTVRYCLCEYCDSRGIFTGFADWVTIEHNECCYSVTEHGIYTSNSGDHPVIRFNHCHHNNGCGIHMNGDLSSGGDGIISDAIVEANIIHDNGQSGGSGINCDGVVESVIFNNLLYNNHSSGISLYRIDGATGSHDVEIYNNTIVQPDDGRWGININTGSTNATLRNNIVLSAHSWRGSIKIDASSMPGFTSDYSILEDRLSIDGGSTVITLQQWQIYGYDIHSQVCSSWSDLFLNWQQEDYHITSSSQATDTGTDEVQSIVQFDLDGITRPQGTGWDIGSYEYSTTGIDPDPHTISQPGHISSPGMLTFIELPSGSSVTVFDICGRRITRLYETDGQAVWNTGRVPCGIYLYVLSSSGNIHIYGNKAVIVRN